ncbi:PaaI family thioesterase [Alicyclobacillaceae bacterium I2511]|nr:PaaI family thioesterase [Alicyclobacillaceae bacterium I2511]
MGSSHCFVCGQENPQGLHIHFSRNGVNGIIAHFQPESWQEGWPGIIHGGLTGTILDEATAYVALFLGHVSVTAEMNVSYLEPIRIGERLEITAWPTRQTRRIIEVSAQITGPDGVQKARSQAKMMVLTDRQKEAMGLSNLPDKSNSKQD